MYHVPWHIWNGFKHLCLYDSTECRNLACHNLSKWSFVLYTTFIHLNIVMPLLSWVRKLFFEIFLTAHVSEPIDCSCVIWPFFNPFTFFFLLNMLFQTGHDVPPFASSHYKGGITHFCLMTLPLYIYLRIKFIFCITLLDLVLWSLLTCRSSCLWVIFCLYFFTNFKITFDSDPFLQSAGSPFQLNITLQIQ